MRIVAIADDNIKALEGLPDSADIVVSLGNLWDNTILEVAKQTKAQKVFALKGDCDSNADFPPHFINMHRRAVKYGKWTFGGLEGSWKCKEQGHHLYSQEEADLLMDEFPTVDIFFAHNSPAGVHEQDTEAHQGFNAFKKHIETTKPYLFLHGHQHIAQNSHVADTEVIGVFGNAVIELE